MPPAQIKAFAASQGTQAKTDRIDAELIARFMHCPAGDLRGKSAGRGIQA
ncbi:hypothetical protein [Leisingera sp. NJS204]